MNTIYEIKLNNGTSYIGRTRNFEKRLAKHLTLGSKAGSKEQPVHAEMRKYGFAIIVLENIVDLTLAEEAEIFYIAKRKEEGIVLHNKQKGGITGAVGKVNGQYIDLSEYETIPVERSKFKKKCDERNEDFDNYKEVYALNKGKNKYYNYIKK